MSASATQHYRLFLDEEFALRRKRNPGYSLRAFARDLEIPPSKLSEILRGLSGLSGKSAARIGDKLGLSPEESRWFVLSVEASHARGRNIRARASEELASLSQGTFDELSLDKFKIISDWFHFAIMELTDTPGFQSDVNWIANRLKITVAEADEAIRRLMDHGLLKKDETGRIRQTQIDLATPSGIPSREIRKHHLQILLKAQEALEECAIEKRDFSALTMRLSERQLPEAKRILKDFRRQFDRLMKMHEDPKDRVYSLAIQFFPLDQENQPRDQ